MYSREEVQRAANEWYRLQEERNRACDRANMCSDRWQRAAKRGLERGFFRLFADLIRAVLLGQDWPWAEVDRWEGHTKRARRHIKEIEAQQRALEKEFRLIVVQREEREEA